MWWTSRSSWFIKIKRLYGLSGCHREGHVFLVRPELLLETSILLQLQLSFGLFWGFTSFSKVEQPSQAECLCKLTTDNPVQKWLLIVLERILGVRDTTPSMCVMRECGLEHLQFNWFCATMRLHNSLTQCNSTTAKHILHADMRLSSRSDDCWSSHIFSAMTGLIQE